MQDLNHTVCCGVVKNFRKESLSPHSDVFSFDVLVRNMRKEYIGSVETEVLFPCRYFAKKENVIVKNLCEGATIEFEGRYDCDAGGASEKYFRVDRLWIVKGGLFFRKSEREKALARNESESKSEEDEQLVGGENAGI